MAILANSHTEWGTLREVVVGTAEHAQIPELKGHDIHCVDYADRDSMEGLPGGSYPKDMLAQTQADLDAFAQQLQGLGIVVHRPDPTPTNKIVKTPDWQTDGYYYYCPRDSVLVVGNTMIETPMALRSRYFETFSLRHVLNKYSEAGSPHISAPKPQLLDELYDRTDLDKPTLLNTEPCFDAANVIRCGRDIFYLVSNSGNHRGAQWLQNFLGSDYKVHVMDNIYAYVHVDTSILPLAPGKVLLNPDRVNADNLPDYFKSWDKIWAPEPVVTPCLDDWAPGSPWIGMNVLSLSPTRVAVEERQKPLIDTLEKSGFNVLQVKLTHCRTLSGGPHCVTLDTVRSDEYGDYS